MLLNRQQGVRCVHHGAHPLRNGQFQLSPNLADIDPARVLDVGEAFHGLSLRPRSMSAGTLERHEQ